MLPRTLQGKLVFLFVALIFITNGFLAIAGFSRERIQMADDTLQTAYSLGKILQKAAESFLQSGDSRLLDHIMENRAGISRELFLTVYDNNWWKKWGDEERIPPGGFPDVSNLNTVEIRVGPDKTYRELFFPIIVDGTVSGAVGVGVPPSWLQHSKNTAGDFAWMMILSMFLGLIVAVFASRSILVPLTDLMNCIQEFGAGDYSVRVGSRGAGELKELGDSFNRMALTVQETFKENLQRNRAIDEKLQELWEIYELMRKVTLNNEFKAILEKFLEKAQTLSFSSFGQIILKNRRSMRFEEEVSISSTQKPKVTLLENVINMAFVEKTVHESLAGGMTIIGIPLLTGNKVNGVMVLAKNDAGGYSEGVRRFLETIAPVLASLIENAALYEELSDWNQQMKNILASINQGLATIDHNRRFLIANDRFFSLSGVSGFDIATQSFFDFGNMVPDLVFANNLMQDVDDFFARLTEGTSYDATVGRVLECRAGDDVSLISVHLLPLYAGHEIRGCVLVVDDVTDQKKIEQQMLESEKWAVLGRLAASVAHEIRNPLVAIRSLVEIIRDEVQGDLKEHANVIIGEVLRLNRVVAELLSLVRPETASLKKCDLVELINELLLLVRHEAMKNEIRLVKTFPETACDVFLDPEKIKQAVLNLVLNAFQAAGRGGIIEISLEKNAEAAVISVGNNGPMIEESVKARIFEPFFTTRSNGTGLGLAITRKIVELHKGRVEFTSGPDQTVFKLYLPDGAVNV